MKGMSKNVLMDKGGEFFHDNQLLRMLREGEQSFPSAKELINAGDDEFFPGTYLPTSGQVRVRV
tara:strand:+ start:406 stop:597 length:192 start_codon:yes stop_codon:yes gene_type:complete